MKSVITDATSTLSQIFSILRNRPEEMETAHDRSRERYRRIALTSAASFGSRAIGVLVSLVSIPLTFRYLGVERYGLLMVLTSLIALMNFADLGIGNGLVNCVSEAYGKGDRGLAREYVTSALVSLLIIAVVVAIAGLAAYPLVPWMRVFNVKSSSVASEGAHAFLVLFFWFIVSIPLGVVPRIQAGLQQGYWSQLIGAGGSLMCLAGLVLAVKARANLPLLVFASTFGSVGAPVCNAWLLFREHPWLLPARHAYSSSSANKIINLGLMFFVLQCAIIVGYTSDNLVITQILGVAAVSVYAVPQKIFSIVSSLVTMGLSPVWPAYGEAIARGDVAWVRTAFRRSVRAVVLFACPTCTFLILAGPWILRVAVGKTLHVPMSLFVVLGVWGVVSTIAPLGSFLLSGAGIMKEQAILAAVASATNLALSIILTRRFGVIGVCLGSIISQLGITLPVYLILIQRLFKKLSMTKIEGQSEAITEEILPR